MRNHYTEQAVTRSRGKILVPVDVERRCFHGVEFAREISNDMGLQTTLLHVAELNIFPLEQRVYGELCAEYLNRLGAATPGFIHQPRLLVRVGKVAEEILAAAGELNPDLIVMGVSQAARRRWPFQSGTVDRVVRDAHCMTLVLSESWKGTRDLFGRTVNGSRIEMKARLF